MISIQDIILLSKKYIKQAAETLASAFEDFPLYTFLLPEKFKRKEKVMVLFETYVRYGLRFGRVYATSLSFEGIAIWLNFEEMKTSLISYFRCGMFKCIRKLGLKDCLRLLKIVDYLEELHEKNLPEPHWYLFNLGVLPDHQGKGYGTVLIEEMLKLTEKDNWPYYLETSTEENAAYFQKFGFKIVEVGIIPKSNVKNLCMIKSIT